MNGGVRRDGPFPSVDDVPTLSTEQMIEVDRLMIEGFGIELLQMMENAGRALARLVADRFLDADPVGRDVVVLAGTGGNGGGALVATRRLSTWGARVRVAVTGDDAAFREEAAHQLRIVRRLGISVTGPDGLGASTPIDVVLDGVIGYSLSGPPRGGARALIERAQAHPAPVVSLDVPSGIDATSGSVCDPAVRAAATLTLALPKTGLRLAPPDHVGELYLADIGVPSTLYAQPSVGVEVGPLFAAADVVRVGTMRAGGEPRP